MDMPSCNADSSNSSVGAKVSSFFRRLVTSHKDGDTHTCIPHEQTHRALDLYQQLEAESGVASADRTSLRRARKSAKSYRKLRRRGKQNEEAADGPEVPERETSQAVNLKNQGLPSPKSGCAAQRHRREGGLTKRVKTTDARSTSQRMSTGTRRYQQERNIISGFTSGATRLSAKPLRPNGETNARSGRHGSGIREQCLEKNLQRCKTKKIRPKTCVVREPIFVWRGSKDGLESIPICMVKNKKPDNKIADEPRDPKKVTSRERIMPSQQRSVTSQKLPPWPPSDPLDGLEELLDDVVRLEERIRLRKLRGCRKAQLFETTYQQEERKDRRDIHLSEKMQPREPEKPVRHTVPRDHL